MNAFKMPKPVKVTGLSSSITKSFVNGIIPCITPTEEEVQEALSVLGMTSENIRCAYCGDVCTEWDHLNPLISNKTPTGYISEIHNLVPSCSKCNQSKGNKEWQEWIVSSANLSPKTRDIPDLDKRIERLKKYEATFEPMRLDFQKIVDEELWAEHWHNYEVIISALEAARDTSDAVKKQVAQAAAIRQREQHDKLNGPLKRKPPKQTRATTVDFDIESSLRSIGKWFFLQNFESIYEWQGNKRDLVTKLSINSAGKSYKGTWTSVGEALRIRKNGASGKALKILLKSDRFLNDHPEAPKMIQEILARHPEL